MMLLTFYNQNGSVQKRSSKPQNDKAEKFIAAWFLHVACPPDQANSFT
jgi:hypothetical protein